MKLYTFLFIKIIFICVIISCFGYREICTGPNHGSPCFIYTKPDETFFQSILQRVDKILAIQVRKMSQGYKRNPDVLMEANSYLLRHLSQLMIKNICTLFPKNLIYKNPTLINLEYHKNQNQVLRNQGNIVKPRRLNWAHNMGLRGLMMLRRGSNGRK
uniref:Uncharacterized protein n=1 Tax=Strongyloides venezuelensis TaxID=75913 RepID=A0A0K0FXE1_STRVS